MSRNTRWKLEKTKVKVVFRLQFHATHIPQTGWNNLFISFIPTDSGKASAKTNKANVRNGTCKWADPIYETTRLLQDSKTKQYEEKLYKLVVAMGTSRSSLLGEANINLSDYVDAAKPTVVMLPLQGSDTGAILHVTVQLLTSKTGFREFEQQREVSDRGLSANTDHVGGKLSTPGEAVVSRADKVNQRVRFKQEPKELPSLEEESGLSEGYADSAAGFDGSSNTSGSLCTEKLENSSTKEADSVKSTTSGDLGGFSASQSPTIDKEQSDPQFLVHGTNDWIHHWGAESSVEKDMMIVYEENSRLRGALEAADLSIHELRQEIVSLQNFADGLSIETHKLTEQIAVEISSEQNLTKEVSMLKLECLRFKHDLERVSNLKINPPISVRKLDDADQAAVLQDLSLGWLNGLKHVEEKIYRLQNKVYNGAEGNFLFLQSDLEELRNVLMDLKQETEHSIYQLGERPRGKSKITVTDMSSTQNDHAMVDTGLGVELCHPEGVILPGLLNSGTSCVDANNEMQGEIFKLLRELDESKAERENLVQKMGQMECYYEALIQELEVNQKQILGELQNLRHEHASCIYTVSSSKAQMEAMHQQMNDELLHFAEERCSLDALNKELERRAVTSEAVLKRARLNYSIAVNQLQKDLEVLSLQVLSMYETNENLIKNTLSEASLLPILQGYKEAEVAARFCDGSNVDNILELPSRDIVLKSNHLGADRLLDDLKSSLAAQEDLHRKMLEELSEMHLANVNLDVFSMTLHQVFSEFSLNSRSEMHELAEQLELSFRSNESLRLRLQNVSDEICTLKEERDISVSRGNDFALENQKLESNFRCMSDEKCILSERIEELESLVTELREYKSKFEVCDSEKARLANHLEQAAIDKHLLLNEVSLLQEEVTTMKIAVSESEKLQTVFNYLRGSLENLLAIGEEQFKGLLPCWKQDKSIDCEEFISIFMRLEECLRNLHDKSFQLTEEKTNLLIELDVARDSFASAEAEVKVLKQELEHDVLEMISKLNSSSALVEKLQTDFEAVSYKLQVSSVAEEKCTQMTQDLLSDFTKMENALHELSLVNRGLADMIIAFGSINDELEGNKLTVGELQQENLSLTESLQNKISESDMLTKELDDFKGTMESMQDELALLRGVRDQLDAQILNLNSELKERDNMMSQLDQQKAEINDLKQQLLDVESEKLDLQHRLSCADAQIKNASQDGFSTDLEFQLLDMHGLQIAEDVVQTVVVEQYKLHVEELLCQLQYFRHKVEEVEKKNFDLSSELSNCLVDKENYAAENATLVSDIDSLKSNLEYNVALNQDLEHSNSSMGIELKEWKEKCGVFEVRCEDDDNNSKFEIVELNRLLRGSQNEVEDLILSKEELEIRCIVLQTTIDESSAQIVSLEECREEQETLQKKCNELSRKLSEQILKAEEFKNLSIHLKELKDKADADHLQAHEKREASKDSLRIAFIKEQYETKLQEIRHQLTISKKHGEEMLWKLQDALDELEIKKKCEASQLKRNEELTLRVSELEAELQLVLSDNCEKFGEFEQLKAELDCAVMSLDCCKEEKNQLTASLQECNDYKCKLADEVDLLRKELENLKASMRREVKALEEETTSIDSDDQASHSAYSINPRLDKRDGRESNPQSPQEVLTTEATEEFTDVRYREHDVEHNGDLLDHQLKPQILFSSIERLQKELERMRSENTLLPEDQNPDELAEEALQQDHVQLEMINEELENMSSLYNDSSRTGNSVERVLALELELAEALQSKKKPNVQFQSSFMKLHSDEAAVFQSFRDINELIKDMLEMKEKHNAMETELREMHERYSQLSLDFAEVEGERQKLTMMLKNARPSKGLFSRSPTSSHEELSS
ncbi:hypothetical protein RND81_03G057600 [Saponaria officinalis]|uniref:C2 NT-type domain-containing protein n=2 Tax=Saponaria officinalis TaxID=3572 RepID=A0AAW1M409_SAPOF